MIYYYECGETGHTAMLEVPLEYEPPRHLDIPLDPTPGAPHMRFSLGIAREIKPEPPHSRACGIRNHDHGVECHSNCPSCGGRDLKLRRMANG